MTLNLPKRLGGDEHVEIFGEKEQVALAFLGRSEPAEVAGASAIYRNAAPGVDIELRVVPGGLKEDLVLRDPDAERNLAYRLTTESADIDVRPDRHRGLSVVRERQTLFRIPAPVTFDADGTLSMSDRISAVRIGERQWRLEMRLDDEWLDSPGLSL